MEAIGQADSIEKINDELDSAKEDIQNVIDQKDGVLDTLKENAKKNIDEARDAIQTESQLPDEVVAMAKEQIDAVHLHRQQGCCFRILPSNSLTGYRAVFSFHCFLLCFSQLRYRYISFHYSVL